MENFQGLLNLHYVYLLLMMSGCFACPNTKGLLDCSCTDVSLLCNGSLTNNASLFSEILNTIYNTPNKKLDFVILNVQDLEPLQDLVFENCTIKHLTISNAGMENLSDDVFSGINDGMILLDLHSNKFDSVPINALTKLPKLQTLDLSENMILKINEHDFSVLDHLKYLRLNNNNITAIEDGAFINLKMLEDLDLNYNHLSFVKKEMFTGLTSLHSLSLAGNSLNFIDKNLLLRMPKLEFFNLALNNFTSFSSLIINSSTLIQLSLNSSGITGELKGDFLCGLLNLQELDLSNNSINKVIFNNSCDLKLDLLNLSSNSLSIIDKYSFNTLLDLASLDLQKNSISYVDENAFLNLEYLQYLNLDDNKLQILQCRHTSNLLQLDHIGFKNNKMRTITVGTFKYSTSLTHIDLDGNHFVCDCHLQDFSNYLKNNHDIASYVLDSAVCSSPPELANVKIINVNFNSMGCPSLKPCNSSAASLAAAASVASTEVNTNNPTSPLSVLLSNVEFKVIEYGDGELCFNWQVYGLQKGLDYNCTVTYREAVSTSSEIPFPLECSHMQLKQNLTCITLVGLQEGVHYDACLYVTAPTKMVNNCSDSITAIQMTTKHVTSTPYVVYTNATTAQNTITDTATTNIENNTVTFFSNTTENSTNANISLIHVLYNKAKIPIVSDTIFPGIFQENSTQAILQNDTLSETIPPSLNGDGKGKEFLVKVFKVEMTDPQNAIATWEVNNDQLYNVCILKLTVWSKDMVLPEAKFNCTNGHHHIPGLREAQTYSVCLNSSHNILGPMSNCTEIVYFNPSTGASSQTKHSNYFPYLILIVLLIVVAVIIAIILIRAAVRKRKASEMYKVSDEEKKLNRQSCTFSVASDETECMLEQSRKSVTMECTI